MQGEKLKKRRETTREKRKSVRNYTTMPRV